MIKKDWDESDKVKEISKKPNISTRMISKWLKNSKITKKEVYEKHTKLYESRNSYYYSQVLKFTSAIAESNFENRQIIFVDETGIRADASPKRL